MSNRTLEAQADIFAALADITRLRLIEIMKDGQARSISDLANVVPITRQGVTKHLKVLEGAGLVEFRREGREARYRWTPEPLTGTREYLDMVASQWEDALSRLKAHAEADGDT
ncbi:ArsR/SmtB family transcription factor [Qingshengfaniella alkalisoli]|uniref:Winged helix-turn-helix transcriptional regulator n=1 Tax=Qingshengfaniella alkalisoli TaxID=2599296 RepID=A0A5B8IWM5_9RHOB|nr:metalloregulator ArsR/SmtB family transcription factor [Qingshengfaniella alkalisoli]QDY69943.1 winged helix-turn-helix transcriptional regulator [Qingshengfaniella alkalisoli]